MQQRRPRPPRVNLRSLLKDPPATPVVMASIERPWKKCLAWGLVALVLAMVVGAATAPGPGEEASAASWLYALGAMCAGVLLWFAVLQYHFERRLRAAVRAGVIVVRPDHPRWQECAIVQTGAEPEPVSPPASHVG